MSWTHLSDTQPRSKKRRLCCLCERAIEAGEVHIARSGIGDDGPMTTRMHIACEALTKSWDEGDWECTDPTTFREMMEDMEARK